ncbi:ROK family protein [Spirochaeta cellobiosiphila]|uniref:ROK family protein n=1 Tax=Spirochaeta cellobiosiphila TaxID=504483 RepID=UPI000429DADE|nr:ROK family protein [Spirochaeta cellobiosiphila]
MKYAIGVDIGGTTIKGVVYQEDGTFSEIMRIPTRNSLGETQVLPALDQMVHSLMKGQDGQLVGIGAGSPGLVDEEGNLFGSAVNIPGWGKFPLRQHIQDTYNVAAFVSNDVNLSAYGEYRQGVGKGSSSLVCINLGTGVGAGLVLQGQLYAGYTGMAGEIGHVIVEEGGRLCSCGLHGCLERYSSATGINESAHLLIEQFDTPFAQLIREKSDPLYPTAKDVYLFLDKGDALAKAIHDISCRMLAKAIGQSAQILNPSLFVLGGGVMEAGDVILNQVRDYLDDYVLPMARNDVKIARALLGEKAGVYGAALYGWDSCS